MKKTLKLVLSIILALLVMISSFSLPTIRAVVADETDPEVTADYTEDSTELEQPVESELSDEDSSLEDEIVSNDVFISIQPYMDEAGNVIDTAETGEKLTAQFYAFNDNPNATAIAKIRVFVDQITFKTDKKIVTHQDTDKIILKGEIGGEATTITAEWKTLDKDDPDNENDYAMDYLEFELPAGASVSTDIELSTETGYDKEIKANVYAKYKAADKEGNYPDAWSSPQDFAEGAELTWTGAFEWANFRKTASPTAVGYGAGRFEKETIEYKFSADNIMANALTGVIYTEKISLEDTVTLPEMLSLPDGASASGNKIINENGATIYEINVNGYDFNIDELEVVDAKNIEFKITVFNDKINVPEQAAGFNPLSKVNSKLYLNTLIVSGDEQITDPDADPVVIDNEAIFEADSVEANEGDDKQTYTYQEQKNAEVQIVPTGTLIMSKDIIRVVDTDGSSVSKVNNEWQVKRNYKVTYQITLENTSDFDKTANRLYDTLPKGLTLDQSSLVTRIGTATASSSKDFVIGQDGSVQIQINNFIIPAHSTGTVTYTVTVDEKDYTPDTVPTEQLPLKNVASFEGTTVEVPVRRMPETKITLKKQVVARYTKSLVGADLVIYGEWDPRTEKYTTVEARGDMGSLYRSGSYLPSYETNPSSDSELVAALHQFDGGDTIVYRIYLLNEGDTDFEGSIIEWSPFVGNPACTGSYIYASYYKYQATGNTYYYETTTGTGNRLTGDLGKTVNAVTCDPNGSGVIVGASGFTDNANSINQSGNQTTFSFGGNKVLKAGEDYVQSMIVVVPGNQTGAIVKDNNENAAFEKLATAHSYYCNFGPDFGHCAGYLLNGSFTYSNYIYHTVAGQTSVDTGVAATSTVENVNSIKDGEIRVCVSGPDGWKGNPDNNMTTFQAKDTQTIVNYVYIFNDSDRPMRMSDKSVELNIPYGFRYLGLTKYTGQISGSTGGTFCGFAAPSSQININQIYSSSGDWVCGSSIRSGGPTVSNTWTYGEPEQITSGNRSDYTFGSRGIISVSGTPSQGGNGTKVVLNTNSPVLNPYTGMLFYYVTCVDNTDVVKQYTETNKAKFTVELKEKRGGIYIPRMSPAVKIKEYYNFRPNNRAGLDNPGIMSSFENKSGQNWLDNSYNTAGGVSPMEMKAGVELYERTLDIHKISVFKEVIKNSGEDSVSQYRTENIYNKDDLTTSYDNYYWVYPRHDGVHRTVDGTVTWKMTVKNQGTGSDKPFSYGVLSDTIDSPYELAEIKFPGLIFHTEDGSDSASLPQTIFKLPVGDAGWDQVSDGISVYTIDTASGEKVDSATGAFDSARIRITRKLVKGGSLGWGYDAEAGDLNVDAYRYIIEVSDFASGGKVYKPILNNEESLDAYMTFATTDSIETNYNSFSLVLPGTNPDGITISENGKKTTIQETHNGKGVVAEAPQRTNRLMAETTAVGKEQGIRLLAAAEEAPSGFATGGNYATEASDPNAPAIEYSDWTDTSYTDALKTITAKEKSINSRTNGNMVLPEKLAPGDEIHSQLAVESVIYESENYSYFDDLVIYDLYGLSSKFTSSYEKNLCGYDVDFESIEVSDSLGNIYTRGEDYDIYYTDANLVYTEHHPISPVNTLKYAADYEEVMSNATTWTLYEGGDVSYEQAHAFKVVFRPGKGSVYNDRTDVNNDVDIPDGALKGACFIYVDFDAVVPQPGSTFKIGSYYSYPNVEMYTATMHQIGEVANPEQYPPKPFWEDTTAINYETRYADNIKFKKLTEVEEGLTPPEGSRFKYLILSLSNNANTVNVENIRAAAVLTVEPDIEYELTGGKNLTLIYENGTVSDIGDFFIGPDSSASYRVLEIDSGEFTHKSTTGQNGSYTTSSYGDVVLNLADLNTTDPDVNAFLSEMNGETIGSLLIRKNSIGPGTSTNITISSVNSYQSRDLVITKTDMDGNIITSPVKFELLNEEGDAVKLSKDNNNYFYDEDGTLTEIAFEGGTVNVKKLKPGKYTLVETEAPFGYKIDDGRVEVDTTKGDATKAITITVKDPIDEEVQIGKLNLRKIDAATKEVIVDDEALFEIYSSQEEGAEPLTFVMDAEGNYIYAKESSGEYFTQLETTEGVLQANDLPFGTYYVVEAKAPKGYLAAGTTLENATEVEVARNNPSLVTEISNTAISGSLSVTKIDSDSEKAITGSQATFNITSEDGAEVLTFKEKSTGLDGAYIYDAEGTIKDLKTDKATGKLDITGLPQGKYSVVETEAPVGYAVSSDSKDFEIKDNVKQEVTVADTPAEAVLKLVKKWKLEGASKTRSLNDVEFTLYKYDAETQTAEKVDTGVTDNRGELRFEGLDWKAKYYLIESVPAGYVQSANTKTVFIDDSTGNIDFNVTEAVDGYTEEKAIEVNMAGNLEEIDNEFVYTENVLNIKNMVYGGMYASVSYKTIDNKKAAATYPGLPEQTGYGFYYTEADYAAGNYNYVDAINAGDIVTYTLNVSNISDYDFGNFSIIDRLPERDDTGVVNLKEKRDSEFTVTNSDGEFEVKVDGTVLDPSMYEVSFSDKVEFTNGDFNGTTEWTGSYDTAKSVRIKFSDEFLLEPGQTVVVTFDGKISDTAKPGEIAWNDFAYRYTAIVEDSASKTQPAAKSADDDIVVNKSAKANSNSRDVVITPEPPKVGVRIVEGKTVIGGEKKYECKDSTKKETETFTFKLTRSDALEYGVTYLGENGEFAEFPAEGLTVDVKATLNGEAVKFEFPELHFSHTGKYEFNLTEIAGDNKDITYDSSEYHIVVDGTDIAAYTSEDGIKPVYTKDGEETSAAVFTNTKNMEKESEKDKEVMTGDSNNLLLYLLINIISAIIVVGVIVYRRRKNT